MCHFLQKTSTISRFSAFFLVPLQHNSSKMAKKILFINQEIAPYVPDSEMSLLGRDLPGCIQEKVLKSVPSCPNGEISMSAADSYMK